MSAVGLASDVVVVVDGALVVVEAVVVVVVCEPVRAAWLGGLDLPFAT